jgi:hypothetical protein
MGLYPKADSKSYDKIDESLCKSRIISELESQTNPTRGSVMGPALVKDDGQTDDTGNPKNGYDDIETFNDCWEEVQGQIKAAEGVNPADYSDVASYKAAIDLAAPDLDSTKWFNGMKDKHSVSTFSDLKAKFSEV